ncbi:glycosyltransferase family 4 protein [Pseudomonas sp. BN607]|uniref:MraY family glycosyltransferase n=1 Tax=Pseudomonas sp. BN607 TaxID=2567895 RepID=UPI00245749A0|nr:glycosyltransferase family 4 protein [Pseudomonas sp. BN607]MDH4553060.1 glycosyltransferase family 4 protein [Pseudomonas sp. BN607]
MGIIFFLISAFFASLALTGMLRRYAIARSIIDIPNSRSSHNVPTPRGGGVAIVIAFLLGLPFCLIFELTTWQAVVGIGGAGLIIAIIGFMDDHGHIAARWRLLGHFLSAVWLLCWLGGFPSLYIFGYSLDFAPLLILFATFYLVWLLNLYNFMDGIDGLASIEAVIATLVMSFIYWVSGFDGLAVLPLLLAFSVGGFVVWNFPPAKIFMGDAGSGFLGITLGALSIQGAWASPVMFWCWLILLGVFVVDATYTLARRLARGDKVYEAHRSHAYQYASRLYGRHLPVTAAVAFINLVWLAPIAVMVALNWVPGPLGVLIAYAPLIGLAVKYRAGDLELR